MAEFPKIRHLMQADIDELFSHSTSVRLMEQEIVVTEWSDEEAEQLFSDKAHSKEMLIPIPISARPIKHAKEISDQFKISELRACMQVTDELTTGSGVPFLGGDLIEFIPSGLALEILPTRLRWVAEWRWDAVLKDTWKLVDWLDKEGFPTTLRISKK